MAQAISLIRDAGAMAFLTVLGFRLPWAFQTAMLHGIADLELIKLDAHLSRFYMST